MAPSAFIRVTTASGVCIVGSIPAGACAARLYQHVGQGLVARGLWHPVHGVPVHERSAAAEVRVWHELVGFPARQRLRCGRQVDQGRKSVQQETARYLFPRCPRNIRMPGFLCPVHARDFAEVDVAVDQPRGEIKPVAVKGEGRRFRHHPFPATTGRNRCDPALPNDNFRVSQRSCPLRRNDGDVLDAQLVDRFRGSRVGPGIAQQPMSVASTDASTV